MSGLGQTVTDAVNYVSDTIQGAGKQASHEANKEVAKDGNVPIGTRATAAKDAITDKIDQKKHDANAEVSEQKLKN